MIELLVVLLVLGVAMVVFYPVLAGSGAAPRARGADQAKETEHADDERAALLEREERLLRNLRELDAELAAGRLSAADYRDLRGNDEAEAARILRRLEELAAQARAVRRTGRRPAPTAAGSGTAAARPTRRLGTTLAWVGGTAAFAVLLGITMSRAVTPRTPGGTITGSMPGDGGGSAEGGGAPSVLPRANSARLAELAGKVSRDSTNVSALLEAGHLYLAEQKFDEAARVTVKALSLDPEAPEGHAHIAVLLMAEASSQQDPDSARRAIDGALAAVNHALQVKPDLAEAWLFKGMILMAGMRDQKGAAGAWEQYLKVAPPDADTTRIAAMVRGIR